MSKEAPYWQFEPAAYLAGNIQFCSLEAQGLFVNIQAMYWQRECELHIDQVNRKFNRPELITELLNEKIIKIKNGKISVDFLDKQWKKLFNSKVSNALNGKKGAEKRWRKNSPPIIPPLAETIAPPLAPPSKIDGESMALRREEKRKEEKREEEITPPLSETEDMVYESLFTAENWHNTLLLKHQVEQPLVPILLKAFKNHRESLMLAFNGRKDYISHFDNWLRKIELNEYRQQLYKKPSKAINP